MSAKKNNGTTTATPSLAAISALNGSMSEALVGAQAACAQGGEALRDELVRFANGRLTGTAKTLQELAQCRSPSEAVGVQQQWLMGLGRDYLEESMRLFTLAGEIAQASWKPMAEMPRRAQQGGRTEG